MEQKRTVLLVEDVERNFQAYAQDAAAAGWAVVRARDTQDTWAQIEQLGNKGQPIDLVVADLAYRPFGEDPVRTGLPLVQELRARFETLPILAYTNLGMTATQSDFSLILAKLLPLRISLVNGRHLPDGVTFTELMERVWQGFVIISPGFEELLPYAVATRPDPLSTDLWYTLQLLAQGLTLGAIAERLPSVSGSSGVKKRLERCSELLRDAGELEPYETREDDLKRWYREHYARYCRDNIPPPFLRPKAD